MGRFAHHAILVTSWNDEAIQKTAAKARELGAEVIGPSAALMNGYRTLAVCPDGSKEGWGESEQGDLRRDDLVAWLRAQVYEDGSSNLNWVEVVYGADEGPARIVNDPQADE